MTRLEVVRCIEAGLGMMVLAVSMKTPHRFLRSNEIRLPASGLLDIPLQLTFALQVTDRVPRTASLWSCMAKLLSARVCEMR